MARMVKRECPACGKKKVFRVDVLTCGCRGTNPQLQYKQPEEPKKPIVRGSKHGLETAPLVLPKRGQIKRYIVTSAQNNTYVHDGVWKNLLALAKYYGAEIFVGTFSYDQNSYGPMSVKQGTFKGGDRKLWYDEKILSHINNNRVQLGHGLVWCGENNTIPTASNPLSGFETYSGRQSAIFPHAKIAMRTIAAIQGSGAKLNYTTGTVTMRNYIQKKAGLIAEFHHTYGGLIVEVDSEGIWKVRQLDAEDESGTIYDLTLKVENGVVTDGHRIEGLTHGDIHATAIDPQVLMATATGQGNMLDVLKPKHQFIHDAIEGVSVSHHDARKPLEKYKAALRGMTVEHELKSTAFVLDSYYRPGTKMVFVNSNHDRWLDRWLDEFDARRDDIRNLKIYHDGNLARLDAADEGKDLNVLEYLLRKYGEFKKPAKFLGQDERYLICNDKIDCGQHGDLGPNGSRGSASSLSKVGRPSNVGHSHVTGIYDGLYVAGTSTVFRMGYNHGPSAWTHSHIITYENGKRAIITIFNGEWRAVAK